MGLGLRFRWRHAATAVLVLASCAKADESTPATTTGSETTSGSGGAGGQGGAACVPTPGLDQDGDGFKPELGDCDDCNAAINPNAAEVVGPTGPNGEPPTPVDDDCNGVADDVPTCDDGIDVDAADPESAARALGMCDFVQTAKWVMADGSDVDPADAVAFGLGHGIFPEFGPHQPLEGKRMLALSSGTARRPTDPGFIHRNFIKGYESSPPDGFPKESAGCPGVVTGQLHDAAALEVELEVPSNAQSFRFYFDFFTYEWPQFICSTYNDQFVTILSPWPTGQTDGNVSFDTLGNPVGVNNAYLQSCSCPTTFCPAPPPPNDVKTFVCSLGLTGLVGTDFEKDDDVPGYSNGSTGWLRTSAPVEGSPTIKVRFAIWDSGDSNVDSLVLLDAWAWSTKPSTVFTEPK